MGGLKEEDVDEMKEGCVEEVGGCGSLAQGREWSRMGGEGVRLGVGNVRGGLGVGYKERKSMKDMNDDGGCIV